MNYKQKTNIYINTIYIYIAKWSCLRSIILSIWNRWNKEKKPLTLKYFEMNLVLSIRLRLIFMVTIKWTPIVFRRGAYLESVEVAADLRLGLS